MGSDLLFTMNLLINYLLLLGSTRVSGVQVPIWRLALSAAIGAGYAVGVMLPQAQLLRQPGAMAVVLAMMFWLAFGSRLSAVRQIGCYLVLSLAICGIVVSAAKLLGPDTSLARGTFLYPVSFRAMILMAALAGLICHCFSRHAAAPAAIARAVLTLDGRQVKLPALVDTGNRLRDPLTGKPVLVADWEIAPKLLPSQAAALLTQQAFADPATLLGPLRRQCPQLRAFLVPYHVVGNSGMLLAVRCDQIQVGKTVTSGALVAFSPTVLDEAREYQALTGGTYT